MTRHELILFILAFLGDLSGLAREISKGNSDALHYKGFLCFRQEYKESMPRINGINIIAAGTKITIVRSTNAAIPKGR